jgi:hypothetical protein
MRPHPALTRHPLPQVGEGNSRIACVETSALREIAMEQIEIEKIHAEISKMVAETAKISKEAKWYEVAIIVSATLAIVAIAKLFL